MLSDSERAGPPSAPDKRQLRKQLRVRRRQLPAARQRHAAALLVQTAATLPWFIRARRIAFYLAADGEIDPRPLLEHALRAGKRVFLPRLHGAHLEFAEYTLHMPMRPNRFGIAEPIGRAPLGPAELDAICLPLVGFDNRGGRLGMGGGFYDRTLARRAAGTARPLLIGLAHSFQQLERVPCDPWDIPLSGVLTERGWIAAGS